MFNRTVPELDPVQYPGPLLDIIRDSDFTDVSVEMDAKETKDGQMLISD
jgi:hypothetical protein